MKLLRRHSESSLWRCAGSFSKCEYDKIALSYEGISNYDSIADSPYITDRVGRLSGQNGSGDLGAGTASAQ